MFIEGSYPWVTNHVHSNDGAYSSVINRADMFARITFRWRDDDAHISACLEAVAPRRVSALTCQAGSTLDQHMLNGIVVHSHNIVNQNVVCSSSSLLVVIEALPELCHAPTSIYHYCIQIEVAARTRRFVLISTMTPYAVAAVMLAHFGLAFALPLPLDPPNPPGF
jgi:hypothetical protein